MPRAKLISMEKYPTFATMKTISMGESYSQDYRISCNDMDSEYRMTPQAILNMSQDTIAAYLTTRHVAAFDLQKNGFTWVISEYTIDLTGELPLWREKVEVSVSPSEISTAKIHFDYRITKQTGETAVIRTSVWSIINVATGRPEMIADHCTISGDSACRHLRNKVRALERSDLEFHYITNISDIDFNGHVHNVSYLKIALSCVPYELARNTIVKNVVIKFLRQSFINEDLLCRIEKDDENHSALSSITNSDGQEVCRICATLQEISCRDFGEIVDRN